ncbi:hypothetical protein [Agrobacterium larrymoorei]|uniref:Uncharacterized protein n=1 Tax=Agrobacterium larrymoorei TaxID=160699 RepID=A0ABU0UF47_9HYPH|nr:hypothetical protein [Agrobacterium larrymoorei]MDQ1183556.1 hypothetical protein [Agrobacterium larrymoorei]
MGLALKSYRAFELFLRCENCMRETSRVIDVPPGDDSPNDADELMESGFLANLSFSCGPCGHPIAQLIGIKG